MDINGYLWIFIISMDSHACPWRSTDIQRNQSISIDIHGNPSISIELYRRWDRNIVHSIVPNIEKHMDNSKHINQIQDAYKYTSTHNHTAYTHKPNTRKRTLTQTRKHTHTLIDILLLLWPGKRSESLGNPWITKEHLQEKTWLFIWNQEFAMLDQFGQES